MSGPDPGDYSGMGCPPEVRQELHRRKRNLRTHGFILVLSGIAIQSLGAFFRALEEASFPSPLHLPWVQVHLGDFMGLSFIFIIIGLALGAMAKGRNGLWGALGLLCWIGILIYFCLNAICPYCGRKPYCLRDTCRHCGAPL